MIRDHFSTFQTGVKRGAEEGVTGVVGNGNTVPVVESNDAKKVKLDGLNPNATVNTVPSKVLHLRNVYPDCLEAEVVALGVPFGKMTNILMMRQKNQTFLEMDSVETAKAMVEFYSGKPAMIRSKHIYIQYSNHKELKTDPNFSNPAADMALATAALITSEGHSTSTSVLRVVIDNMIYPITVDVLHTIFSRYGKVLRIVTYTKDGKFLALVQMEDGICAQTSKMGLDGQNIYNGCCTLHIYFSKLDNLSVKYNNEKSRDYTNPDLPAGDKPMHSGGGLLDSSPPSLMGAGVGAPLGGMSFQNPSLMHSGGMHMGMGQTGAIGGLNHPPLGGLGQNPMSGFGQLGVGMQSNANTPVILVSNFNIRMVTPDVLFILFGVYGNVLRVKILYNKQDSALIQFADSEQAAIALTNLDKVPLYGKNIRVTFSKFTQVQLPREDQQDNSDLTKDYTNSPMHRFKKIWNKSYSVFPPSAVLHLSNFSDDATEEELKEMFSKFGNILSFRFLVKERKMAFIELPSVEDGIQALIEMHNCQHRDRRLRVSFSRAN